MFLLKFSLNGKEYFMHNGEGEQFAGATSEAEAHLLAIHHTGKSIGVGGFEVTEVKDAEELSVMIGGVPYSIIDISGGLGIPFCAVEIKHGNT